MTLEHIEKRLEERIGLSAETIGSETIAKALQKRQKSCQLQTLAQYLTLLQHSEDEWDELVENLLVPETWFFRHENSFLFLEDYIRAVWRKKSRDRKFYLLSIPCSSGEEPYSMAMTLLGCGLSQNDFQIDAVDLNRKSLQKARNGNYGPESFRGAEQFAFRDRFFSHQGGSYQIHDAVNKAVNFMRGNLLDPESWNPADAYDVIFCRNVLIYLGQSAKKKTIQTLDNLLTDEGILFVGHAERQAFKGFPFTWVSQPGVFACLRHEEPSAPPLPAKMPEEAAPRPSHPYRPKDAPKAVKLPRFERRSTERFTLKADDIRRATGQSYRGIDRRNADDENTRRLDMARQLADEGKLTEALEQCEHVIKEAPANVQAYFLKGLIFQALRNEKGAEEFLNKVVYLDPNHANALGHLLLIAEHRGDDEKARRLRLRLQRIQGM